jgi:hypothetical protein
MEYLLGFNVRLLSVARITIIETDSNSILAVSRKKDWYFDPAGDRRELDFHLFSQKIRSLCLACDSIIKIATCGKIVVTYMYVICQWLTFFQS